MRHLVIEAGEVTNVIEAESGFTIPDAVLVPSETGNIGDSYVNGAVVPAPAPAPTKADVDAEKDRRKFGGFTFQGVEYQSDLVSLVNISGAGSLAGFAMAAGAVEGDLFWQGAEPFGWIATDNTITPMDAQTTFAFSQAAAAHVSLVTFAAKQIKALDPIPADFKNDAYWGAE